MGEGEKKRREEEEKEEIKPRSRPKRYGCLPLVWNSDFWYGCLDFDMELWFCMDFLSRYKFVGYGL